MRSDGARWSLKLYITTSPPHVQGLCECYCWVEWCISSSLGLGQPKNCARSVDTGPVMIMADVRSDDDKGTGHTKWH